MNKILIIDTFNFLHRAYHALPKTLTDKDGNPTNAIYGVTSMLISVFEQIRPTHVLVALDSEKPTFRVEEFTGYKAHRKPMEDDLAVQIPKVFEIIEAFGLHMIKIDGYEADDIIGTVATKFSKAGNEVIIVSNDRDMWQLINKNTVVMMPTTKGPTEWIGVREVIARLGFPPENLIDFKALRGDPSDNIPGVHGVGEKTALKLIKQYGTVEEIYHHIEEIEPNSLKEKLINCSEDAAMSKKLATIIVDAPFDIKLSDCSYNEINKQEVKKVLEKYNFRSLIKRLGISEEAGEQLSLL